MNKSILSEYYKGILGQLKSEVQLMNNIFKHNGLKGEGNESAIRDLLIKFIPKKYGISSGVVIDHEGNQSRQCDIIIYDNQNYPELLSMSSVKLFPIDIVYMVIEVKTSLDSSKSKIAVENIDSVLRLKYINDRFRVNPTELSTNKNNPTLWEVKSTTPPLGMVFSYESVTNQIPTFINWFSKKNNSDIDNIPSHVCCLDQGILVVPSWTHEFPLIYPVCEGDIYKVPSGSEDVLINNKKFYNYREGLYPYSQVGNDKVLVDQGKTLLNFILILAELLKRKFISPNLNLMEYYLTDDLKTTFSIENNRLVVMPKEK